MDEMTQEEYKKAAIDAVKKLSEDVGIPQSLNEIVKEEDIPALAQSAYEDACLPGNPRETSVEDIVGLYKSLGRRTYRECMIGKEPTVWAVLIQACPDVFYARGRPHAKMRGKIVSRADRRPARRVGEATFPTRLINDIIKCSFRH